MGNEQLKQQSNPAKKDKTKERQPKERQKWKAPDVKRTTNTRMRRISGHR
jgi:hypothetical protein